MAKILSIYYDMKVNKINTKVMVCEENLFLDGLVNVV